MQQWVKKIENSIGVRSVSQQAGKKQTASAEVGTILSPVNSALHQDRVRVRRQEQGFTNICSRNWFAIPLGGSSIPQTSEVINQRPPLSLMLRLRFRLRLRLRRLRAKKVDPRSPFEWKIIHSDPLHRKVTEVHVESMQHIIFHPRTVDVMEKSGSGVPFQAGMISKFRIPPRLGTSKRLAGAFFAASGPFSTPFMLVQPLHHIRIFVNLTTLRILLQWGLTSVIELQKGLQPFER